MVGGSTNYEKSLTSSSNRVLLTVPNLTSSLGNVDDPRDEMDAVNLRFLFKSLIQYDSSTSWGSVLGNINLQTDLINLLNTKENTSNKGVNNGYASLNNNGIVPNTQLGTGGLSTDFLRKDGTYQTILISQTLTVVSNYSALPLPSTVPNNSYVVENSQGTEWLPGSLGGTYYPEGLYFSNGVKWIYQKTSYQALQNEVNTGVSADKFVTPNTLANSTQWDSKENSIIAGTTSQYYRGDKSMQTLDKTAVGLSNVNNTSDVDKPVSSAVTTILNSYLTTSNANSTYQPLDGDLTAIASLTSNGLARKTGINTWVIDSSVYLTSVGVADLTATGTPSSSTYLRGDNTWATVSAGSSGITRLLSQSGSVTAGSTSNSIYSYQFTASGTLTLPTAVSNNCMYIVKNSSGVNIFVEFTSGQNADGSTTITLIPNQSLTFISDNVNYTIN